MTTSSLRVNVEITRWERLESGSIKINCDATWCISLGRGGIGVIVRDHSSGVLGGVQSATRGDSAESHEAWAIYGVFVSQWRIIRKML